MAFARKLSIAADQLWKAVSSPSHRSSGMQALGIERQNATTLNEAASAAQDEDEKFKRGWSITTIHTFAQRWWRRRLQEARRRRRNQGANRRQPTIGQKASRRFGATDDRFTDRLRQDGDGPMKRHGQKHRSHSKRNQQKELAVGAKGAKGAKSGSGRIEKVARQQ